MLVVVTLSIITACNERPQLIYSVKGGIPDSLNGKNVYLYACEINTSQIGTTVVKNGRFEFSDTIGKPVVARLVIGDEDYKEYGCVLDEVPVVVNYDGKQFQVTGSRRTNAMAEYYNIREERTRNSNEHNKEACAVYLKKLKELVKRNTDNVVGAYVFNCLYDGNGVSEDMELQDSILAVAGKEFLGTPFVERVIASRRQRVGQTYTDFELPDQNGKMHRLSDYVGEGKYVLVDIWASWCLGCRMETPKVKKAYEKYHDRGFEVVMVTRDRNEEDWIKAMEKDGVKDMGIQLKDKPDMLDELFGFNYIPCTMLINPEGKIIANELKQNELEEILSKEIGE